MLLGAAKGGDGTVYRMRHLGGITIQANNREYVESHNSRSEAIWEGAVDELKQERLIEDRSGKGQFYRVTRLGYEIADLLGAE